MKRLAIVGLFWLSSVVAGEIDLQVTAVAALPNVVDIKHAGDHSGRLFVVVQTGSVRILKDGTLLAQPFLDVGQLISNQNEQGLLSIAFAPDYATSGVFYVYYTDQIGASILSRYRVSGNPDVADPNSAEILLNVPQPFGNHNGGRLEFGPDGMLYLGIGDGGGAGDPMGNGQNRGTLLGSLLRLDVSGAGGYVVPPDNPFVGQAEVRAEIWAYGLRNPWRMAFDRVTGDLYIADVGQQSIEEIDFQPASSPGGENYGWNIREGSGCFAGDCNTPGLTDPVWQYSHASGCSITGGQVYRGLEYPNLLGRYFYGDFCSGRVWAYHHASGSNELLLGPGTLFNILTFGEDQRGNVYVSASGGSNIGVFLLSDGPPVAVPSGVAIDGAMSGTYVVDGLNDQGFFVTVGENAMGRFLFVAWFTFDESGNPRWLVGVDFFEPGANTVELLMQELSGLNFLDFSSDTAERVDFGTMIFTQLECGTIQGEYNFGANGAGSIILTKLTNIEGRDC